MSDQKAIFDETLDLEGLLSFTDEATPESEPVVAKTPLQQMQENRVLGMTVTEEDLKKAAENTVTKATPINDDSKAGINDKLKELDELIEKSKSVQITQKPRTPEEAVALMDALEDLDLEELKAQQDAMAGKNVIAENGGTAIGLDVDAATTITGLNGGSTTTGNGLFKIKNPGTGEVETAPAKKVVEETPVEEDEEARNKSIQVVIDKTGLGIATVDFTPEEREKLAASTRINVVQVEDVSLKSIDLDPPSDGFLDTVRNDLYKVMGTATTVPLVGSRYRATFRGLSFGEYMNLAMTTNLTEADNLRMRLTTMYQAISNTSIGMFDSFDTFLKHTAQVDIPMITFALYTSTNPELMEVGIRCQRDNCRHTFSKSFVPRQLLNFDGLSTSFVDAMAKISEVDGVTAKAYHESSSTISRKRIVLPKSGIICDLGLVTCYDMLNNRLPFYKDIENVLNEKYPDDTNQIHAMVPVLAEVVAGIILQDEEGNSHYVTDLLAISDVLFNVPYDDFSILMSIGLKTAEDYTYSFDVKDVTCPKCGSFTKYVHIDLDDEIFTQLQTQRNTQINPESLPRL